MKQLLILSGKGGTGKTTLTGAFIKLLNAKAYADCDVDAPNLHLIMQHTISPEITDHMGMPKAAIDHNLCILCGKCADQCRFDAIATDDGYQIDPYECEGCGVCEAVCPVKAISLYPVTAGKLMLYHNGNVFSTAELKMGSGTSGKLVSEVKRQMNENAANADIAVIDGSPGIGCPVIASVSGVDMVLIVAEPSISGISDLKRIVQTVKHFSVKAAICVNKYDTNLDLSNQIEIYSKINGLLFLGMIPFDTKAVMLINLGKTIADENCPSGKAAKEILDKVMRIIQ